MFCDEHGTLDYCPECVTDSDKEIASQVLIDEVNTLAEHVKVLEAALWHSYQKEASMIEVDDERAKEYATKRIEALKADK